MTTEITVIPCRADFEREIPTHFVLNILYHNEFEQLLSVERAFDCWTTFTLQNLGFQNVGGSTFQRTRLNPSGSGICIDGNVELINAPCDEDADCVSTLPESQGVCAPASGILAIVEEFHDSDVDARCPAPPSSPAAMPPTRTRWTRTATVSSASPGSCRGVDLDTTTCVADDQCLGSGCAGGACPAGRCRNSGATCSNIAPVVDCGAGDFCDQCMNDEMRFQPDVVTPIPPMP